MGHGSRIAFLLLCVTLAAGCGGDDGTVSRLPADSAATPSSRPVAPSIPPAIPPETAPGDTTSSDFEGTAGVLEYAAGIEGVAVLGGVRVARHDTFDRVVFEFSEAGLPGYHAEYVDRPVRACGSGEAVEVEGDGWLQIRMTPAQAHTEAGQPTVRAREQKPGLPILRELQLTCDFEADVTWVLGVASPNGYRILNLQNPPRIVVDVKH